MANLVGKTLLDRYYLRAHAGAGGMADVYQAWDILRSTTLAVKVLRRDLALNPRFFQMFAKEAELLRKLDHPNIVRLYEFERSERNLVFIVMDWVEGTSLSQNIVKSKNPLPLDEISRILMPVAAALQYAHKKQVFHCDVKPGNILLQTNGQVLLTDFGVARLAGENTGGGTPLYMAPEQFAGGAINAATDVYALGVVIYEMLSGGVAPFRGDTANSRGSTERERIAWEHLNLSLPPISQFNKRVSEAVEQVIATAMHKQPTQRYPSTIDLREAFEHARMVDQHGENNRTMIGPALPIRKVVVPVKATPVPPPPAMQTPQQARGKPHLYCRSGQWAGQAAVIGAQGLTLGRSSQNQVPLPERSVSRRHATILATRRSFVIRDENSSMGTYVNNTRITGTVRLRHGDIIRIGYQQLFEFHEK